MDLNDRSLGFESGGQRTPLPIPGSARARRTVAQKRVEELGIIGAGHLPVNEVRQIPGSEDMVNS